eukprot:7760430-Alexandrium_andersonii.AAC.1
MSTSADAHRPAPQSALRGLQQLPALFCMYGKLPPTPVIPPVSQAAPSSPPARQRRPSGGSMGFGRARRLPWG